MQKMISVWVYYRGNPDFDRMYKVAAPGKEFGSGSDGKESDVSFEYRTLDAARDAVKRLRAAKLGCRIRVEIYADNAFGDRQLMN